MKISHFYPAYVMIWSNDTLPCVHGPLQGLADLLEIHYTLLHLLHLRLVDVVVRVVHVVDVVDIVSVDDDVVDIDIDDDIVDIVRAHHFHPF